MTALVISFQFSAISIEVGLSPLILRRGLAAAPHTVRPRKCAAILPARAPLYTIVLLKVCWVTQDAGLANLTRRGGLSMGPPWGGQEQEPGKMCVCIIHSE